MGIGETASSRSWLAALLNRLDELGWREGRNLVVQVQWWHDQPEQMRIWAAELMARSPDVVVTVHESCTRYAQTDRRRCADRVQRGRRPGRQRLCRQLGAPGRQHDGFRQ